MKAIIGEVADRRRALMAASSSAAVPRQSFVTQAKT
jgi:hypothetical protein